MTLQERIEQLVTQHGSLRALAHVMECSPPYICRLRANVTKNPGPAVLRKLGLRRVVKYELLKTPTLTDDEQTTLWLGACRYSLGRMSYAVADYCTLLVEHWPALPARTQRLIRACVEPALAIDDGNRVNGRGRLGMDCDREQWEKVRALWAGGQQATGERG